MSAHRTPAHGRRQYVDVGPRPGSAGDHCRSRRRRPSGRSRGRPHDAARDRIARPDRGTWRSRFAAVDGSDAGGRAGRHGGGGDGGARNAGLFAVQILAVADERLAACWPSSSGASSGKSPPRTRGFRRSCEPMSTNCETLRWVGGPDGHLVLLDQTRLPLEIREVTCRDVGAVWEAIRVAASAGRPAIGIAAAYGVVLGLQQAGTSNRTRSRDVWTRWSSYLESSRPTAVNLCWALRRMEDRATSCGRRRRLADPCRPAREKHGRSTRRTGPSAGRSGGTAPTLLRRRAPES